MPTPKKSFTAAIFAHDGFVCSCFCVSLFFDIPFGVSGASASFAVEKNVDDQQELLPGNINKYITPG